jgi:LPPG:FO 2-phospho-L-lactate transferase
MDTVVYTLAGAANPETGWGRIGESWRTMAEVGRLGGPEWFRLGDLDLATHLVRSHILAGGGTLTEASQHLCRFLGIETAILPMSDLPAPTRIETEEGMLPFQSWFVEQQWQPALKKVHLPEDVRATAQVTAALQRADLVDIAPSNPFVSIDPILNAYPVRAMVSDVPELVVAVSPIIEGKAVKGPAGKMMADMNMEVSPAAVAEYYGDVIDAFVYDERDNVITNTSLELLQTDTLMKSQADRERLAIRILQFAMELLEK